MNENEMPSIEEIQSAFGITPDEEPEVDTSVTVDETTPEEGPEESQSETPTETESDETQPEPEVKQTPQPQPKPDTKQAQAFARMRTENASMQKTMAMMAQILGVDPKLPADQLSAQLQSQARNALAKQQNIDPTILARLDQLEQINAEYNQIKVQQRAQQAFVAIQEKYNATNDDLSAFVQEIMAEGYDITAPGADIEQEFIKRNFDKIVENRVNAAVAAEQARSAKASGASKPSNKQGKTEDNTEPTEINSVEALNEFLNKTQK